MDLTQLVAEVNTWTVDDDGHLFDELAAHGFVGVLIKLSQGTRWTNPDGPRLVRQAAEAGLLVGALHYLEPGQHDLDHELTFLREMLPEGAYALGVVLELDQLGGVEPYALTTELESMLHQLDLAGYRTGLLSSSEMVGNLSGAPWQSWLWQSTTPEVQLTRPAATHVGLVDFHEDHERISAWQLTSVRGLNRGDAPAPSLTRSSTGTLADVSTVLPLLDQVVPDPDELTAGPPDDEPELDERELDEPASSTDEGVAISDDEAQARAAALALLSPAE